MVSPLSKFTRRCRGGAMYEHLFSLHTFLPCHPYIFSFLILHMWQSRVKTEHIPLRISIALPLLKSCNILFPLQVGLICAVNNLHIYTACTSPTPNGSSALQCFEHSNAIEICNGIMFDFYPALPHICDSTV